MQKHLSHPTAEQDSNGHTQIAVKTKEHVKDDRTQPGARNNLIPAHYE